MRRRRHVAPCCAAPIAAITRHLQQKKPLRERPGDERTFSIIKPDATERNLTGAINAVVEKAGLRIVAQKRVLDAAAGAGVLRRAQGRPFYQELCSFMTSGPIVIQVLEEDAIARYRDVMGATDPKEAKDGSCASSSPRTRARTPCTAPTAPPRPARIKFAFGPTRSWAEQLA